MTITARGRRHPLNTTFEWRDLTGPFRLVSEAQARSYDERGFFVLEGVFSAAEIAAVTAEIDPVEVAIENWMREEQGGKVFIARVDEITFTVHMAAKSPVLREFVSGPVFQGLGADLIGPDVRLYWDQAVYKKPATDAPFPWHQDNGYAFVEPQQYLTCWVALTDATEDNGCPWVIPGLHRDGTLMHEDSDLGFVCLSDTGDAVPVPVRAGSIVVFSSLTPHSTGPNRTADVRKAYIVQFAPDGAEVIHPTESGPPARTPAAAENRQFAILIDGEPA